MEQADAARLETGVLRARQQLILSLFWFALNFEGAALPAIVIPAQVLLFVATQSAGNAQQAVFVGWLSALGSVTALIVQPLVGSLSDRPGRLGRSRQPYILACTFVLLAGLAGLSLARHVGVFITAYLLSQVGANGAVAAYQVLLPDRVPVHQRGQASGYMGVMSLLGSVGSLAIAGLLLAGVRAGVADGTIERGAAIFYLLSGVVLALALLVTLGRLDEVPVLSHRAVSPASGSRLQAWLEPWRHPNFTWVFLTRGSVILGFTLFLTFIEYYFARVAHVTHFVQATAFLALLALAGALLSSFVLGQMSDRLPRAPVVSVATGCMALAALAFVVAPGKVSLWPLGLVFGVGYGAYLSVDWALAIDSLPSSQSFGKDLGIWSTASTIPAIAAPLVGGLVIGAFGATGHTGEGYRAVFALAVVSFLLGAIFVLNVAGSPALSFWRIIAGRSGSGRARGLLRIWGWYERFDMWLWPNQPIPGAPAGVFRITRQRHRGRPLTLRDGTEIRRGELVYRLHISNPVLMESLSRGFWPLQGAMMGDLRALAAAIQSGELSDPIRAVYGYSVLARGATRLGFEYRPHPHTVKAYLDRVYLYGLMVLYGRHGVERLAVGTTFNSWPGELWMSRDELLRRFSGDASLGQSAQSK